MKSAYEIAMERFNKTAPARKLTAEKKRKLAELDNRYAAKIAEREIALKDEMLKVAEDPDAAAALSSQLVHERKKILAEREDKKEQVRNSR